MTNTMSCGCKIISDNLGAYKIDYCPKHGAAPRMYEVLKVLDKWFYASQIVSQSNIASVMYKLVEDVIAEAGDK